MNLMKFTKQCEEALNNREINKVDYLLLTKISKAIYKEDSNIKMSLIVHYDMHHHRIECDCYNIEDWQDKIKKAVKSAYIYYQNVSMGWSGCYITVMSDNIDKSTKNILSEHRDRMMYKRIGEKRKTNCQFASIVDYIVQLAEKGRYEKCDGILEDLIRNYDTSSLLTEEEMLDDLKTVINGISTDENDEYYIYSDEVHQIADKYNDTIGNIKSTLMVKIRCFDENYLYRDGFFDLNTEDHQIIERKLKGEPYDDVAPFKMLHEIKL